MKFGGAALHYDTCGRGPALLLLHGFPLDLTLWDEQAAAFAPTHTVLRFDLRGFGSTPPGEGLLSMEAIADDAAALLDHLGVGQAVVCGLSMGGYAALAFARRHAPRLRALVLTNTRADADSPEARRKRNELAAEVRRRGVEAAAEAFLPRLLGSTTRATRPDLAARVRAMMLRSSAAGVVNALAGLAARADSTATLAALRRPTLVIAGEEDEISGPAVARAMHAAAPGARLALIPAAGHLSNLEQPAAWNAELRAFLDSLPPPVV